MKEFSDGFKNRYVSGQIIVNMPEFYYLINDENTDLLKIWDWLEENNYFDQYDIQNKEVFEQRELTLSGHLKWTNQQKVLFKLRWS